MDCLKEASRFAKDFKNKGHNIRILKNNDFSDNTNTASKSELSGIKKAKIIENTKLDCKKIQLNCKNSRFSYFLDGIERKKVILNYNFIPVTYGYVAAVILKRTDKKMCCISSDFELKQENLYLPLKTDLDCPDYYFEPETFKDYSFPIKNTGTKDKKTGKFPQFPVEFEQKAHSEIQSTRVNFERDLIVKWTNSKLNDGWLYVDGRIENVNSRIPSAANVVGVIKSHNVTFFNPDEQFKIYNLKKGERTSVFQPIDNDRIENVYTWYLKLHESPYNNEKFGLIRVEVPANERFLAKADEISSWILLETKPVAFPEARWDRMIYPIKYCEDYLKSKAPSWAKIEGL